MTEANVKAPKATLEPYLKLATPILANLYANIILNVYMILLII